MKIRTFAAALVLAGAPALLSAQQQTAPRGEHRGEWQERRGGQGGYQGLMRFRQQLGLSDAQVSRLQGIQQRLQQRNAPVVQRIDAARRQAGLPEIRRGERGEGRKGPRAMRGQRGGRGQGEARPQLTEQQREAFRRFREQVRPLHEQLRQNGQAAMQETRSVLTEQQRAQVQQLMQERRGQRGRRGDFRGQRQHRRGAEHQGHGTNQS